MTDQPFTDIELERAEVQFLLNIDKITSLAEALDIAATNLGRYGMDSFFVLVTDPDTNRQWVVHNGEISDAHELEQRIKIGDKDVEADLLGSEQFGPITPGQAEFLASIPEDELPVARRSVETVELSDDEVSDSEEDYGAIARDEGKPADEAEHEDEAKEAEGGDREK